MSSGPAPPLTRAARKTFTKLAGAPRRGAILASNIRPAQAAVALPGPEAKPSRRVPRSAGTAKHQQKRESRMAEVGIRELLEAGVHFGHQTRRWHPKMRRYIFGERDGIYIIDLTQTVVLLETARQFAQE